jgi:hypothetical protein
MPLTAELTARVRASHTNALDLGTAEFPLSRLATLAFTNGTGAGQVDRLFTDTRTIAPSVSEDLDLAGVLVDVYGATITYARIKGLYIAAAAANTNNVVVGANVAANAWGTLIGPTGASGGTITLRPGAFIVVGCGAADATGWAVTAGTGDLLHVANSGAGTGVNYDIAILGCSA